MEKLQGYGYIKMKETSRKVQCDQVEFNLSRESNGVKYAKLISIEIYILRIVKLNPSFNLYKLFNGHSKKFTLKSVDTRSRLTSTSHHNFTAIQRPHPHFFFF